MSQHIKFLPIWGTVTAAWQQLKGAKRSIWAAIFISFIILAMLNLIDLLLENRAGELFLILFSLVQAAIQYLLIAGVNYLGIKRAQGFPISYRMMFYPFKADVTIKALGLMILKTVIIVGLAFILTLINIYLLLICTPFIIYLLFRMGMALT